MVVARYRMICHVLPTDRPKSVRKRCVIEVLVAFLCCQLVVEFSVGIGAFVIGPIQISFFFSLDKDPVNLFYHTNWVVVVTPTDPPKSVSNRCVIEVFGGIFVFHVAFCVFFGCNGFCHRTEVDLFLSFRCNFVIKLL